MPILTLVIPMLKNDGMKWTLVGRGVARQCQIQRGLLPVLAAPSPSGEARLHSRRGFPHQRQIQRNLLPV